MSSAAQHRENNLAQKFQDCPTIDLLDELKRRKRLRVIIVERMYYTELATADGYLDGIEADLARLTGKKLIDDKLVACTEKPGAMPQNNSPMTIRDAKVIVIVPEHDPDEKSDPTPA